MKQLIAARRKHIWCQIQCSILRWTVLVLPVIGFTAGAVYLLWSTPFATYVLDRLLLRSLFLPNISCVGCNNFTYPYMIDNRNFCSDASGQLQSIFLLILVASFHANLDARRAIRKSWGSLREYHGQAVRTLFVFGRHADRNYNYQVQYELEHYGDVMQVNSTDICDTLSSY